MKLGKYEKLVFNLNHKQKYSFMEKNIKVCIKSWFNTGECS